MSGTAIAADMPAKGPFYKAPPPVSIWEGVYIGVHGGFAEATNDITIAAVTQEFSPSGGLFGLQIGYNHQISPNWILGYEVDVSFGDLSGTRAVGGLGNGTFKVDAFGTARTRLGFTRGPWLLYATGGLAWASTTFNLPGAATLDRPQVGYAVGAGLEYALASNWSAKLEYLYADLDTTRSTLVNAGHTDLTLHTVRLGLNYRFAGLGPTTALAYDAPVSAAFPGRNPRGPFTWTGSYIGVHAGYGWADYASYADALTIFDAKASGGFAGFQSGYNWQLSRHWVVGVESDSSWGSMKKSLGPLSVDVDALGTVRTRLGFAMDRVLFYGTGGLAWAHADSAIGGINRLDAFYLGWAAGAGIEYAFAPRWTAKLEYIFADYSALNDSSLGVNNFSNTLSTQTIKLGVNYRASVLELIGWR